MAGAKEERNGVPFPFPRVPRLPLALSSGLMDCSYRRTQVPFRSPFDGQVITRNICFYLGAVARPCSCCGLILLPV